MQPRRLGFQTELPIDLQLTTHPKLACYACALLRPWSADCPYFGSHDPGLYCERFQPPICEDCGHTIDAMEHYPYGTGVPLCPACERHRRSLVGVSKLDEFFEITAQEGG